MKGRAGKRGCSVGRTLFSFTDEEGEGFKEGTGIGWLAFEARQHL